MGMADLALFVTGMWALVLGVAAFLVMFVAPIDRYLFDSQGNAVAVSLLQGGIAVGAVIALVLGLSRMKNIYLRKKLKQTSIP